MLIEFALENWKPALSISSASALSGCDEESSSSVKIAETTVPAPAVSTADEATAVGALAMEYFKVGKVESAMEHKPDYLRLSQAERERAEKDANRS